MTDWESLDEGAAEEHYFMYSEPERSDGEESHDSWYDEEDGTLKPGVRMPERWRFLWKWFNTLKYKVSVSESCRNDTHDVRIGREPDDWWIDVVFMDSVTPDLTREAERKRFRLIREALILTTLFAEVDYDTWLSELKFTSKFKPREYMDLKTHRLQRKYSFTFYGDCVPEAYSWEKLQNMFGGDHFSTHFTSDLKTLATLAMNDGVDVYAVETIPIEFQLLSSRFCYMTRTEQYHVVRKIHYAVTEIRVMEIQRRTRRRSKRLCGAPVFSLDGLVVNFRAMEIRSRLLKEIQRFVESGVHFKLLTLPMCWKAGEYDSDDEIDEQDDDEDDLIDDAMDVWVPLARTLTGQGTRPTRVSRLVLSPWYCREPLMAAFCSALATSRGLQFLRLEACQQYYEEDCVSWRTWAWLGYALFNKTSTSSVEALSLSGFQLDDEILDSLEDAKNAADPLAYLWRQLTDPEEGFECFGSSSRPPVTIMRNAKMNLYDTDHSDEYIYAALPITGIAMDDGPIVDVMVPGYGFCRVDRAHLLSKKQRCSSSDPIDPSAKSRKGPVLSTVLLDFNCTRDGYDERTDANTHLPRLLKIVGASLTSLSINAVDVDDDSLILSLARCPRLTNLSLGGMTLESMQPITSAYENGIKLSSLELYDFTIATDEFDAFLNQLASNKYLQRLRFGDRWKIAYRKSTAEALQCALETNERLQLVHLYRPEFQRDRSDKGFKEWNCLRFDRQLIVIPLDVARRLAFLSILRPDPSRSKSELPRAQLSEDVVMNMFEFAATSSRRMVIDQVERGFMFGRYD